MSFYQFRLPKTPIKPLEIQWFPAQGGDRANFHLNSRNLPIFHENNENIPKILDFTNSGLQKHLLNHRFNSEIQPGAGRMHFSPKIRKYANFP